MLISGVPIILSLLVIIQGYILTIKKTKDLPDILLKRLGFKPSNLLIYPIVLNITLLPSVIDSIQAAYYFPPSFWLIALEIGISHLIGLINAIMYVKLRGLYYTLASLNSSKGASLQSMNSPMLASKNRETYVPSFYSVDEIY